MSISPSYLRHLYYSRGIRFKATYSTYALTPAKEAKVRESRLQQFDSYLKIANGGKKLIYMDESIFKPYRV